MRERIDVSEIEAQTKIRAKYLRALENEEWGLLPGPTFVKSFLRTYARRSASTARRSSRSTACTRSSQRGDASRSSPSAAAQTRPRPPSAASGASRGYMIAVGSILAVIVLADRPARDQQLHEQNPRRPRPRPQRESAWRPSTTSGGVRARQAVHGDVVALSITPDRRRLRVPARRRRAQADPGRRTAARAEHPDLPRQALRGHARQQRRRRLSSTAAAHRAGLQRGDRLLDHQGARPPHAAGARSSRPASERRARASSSRAPRC